MRAYLLALAFEFVLDFVAAVRHGFISFSAPVVRRVHWGLK